ncbi:MAG: response regulator [Chloroflexi bacterium]|nr:response regulator [Chloroflexota bacterium]
MTRPTILIADDDNALRLLLKATIESERVRILEAADGDLAWQILERYRPAVAILDIQMPGPTGLELARAIRADPQLAATHVMLVTAKERESDIHTGFEAGADRYFVKPFSTLDVLRSVQEVLQAG